MSRTPCQTKPDDWFISRDGKQYPDDELLPAGDARRVRNSVLRLEGETEEEHAGRADSAVSSARRDRKRSALTRRRHAKEACHAECWMRQKCLSVALDRTEVHGTWGGFYEEELAEYRSARRLRG